jgi:hypothetical protein
MIRIVRSSDNPKLIWVAFKPGFPLGENEEVFFSRECASEIECKLLCEKLQSQLGLNMEEIRKVSYQRGWKQAKAKKGGKCTWFATHSAVLPWER